MGVSVSVGYLQFGGVGVRVEEVRVEKSLLDSGCVCGSLHAGGVRHASLEGLRLRDRFYGPSWTLRWFGRGFLELAWC